MSTMVETFPMPPTTTTELLFAIREHPCPRCGAIDFSYQSSDYPSGAYRGTCAGCSGFREFRFPRVRDLELAPPFTLAPGAEPTRWFTAQQLRTIADRERARLPDHPDELPTLAALAEARVRLVKLDRPGFDGFGMFQIHGWQPESNVALVRPASRPGKLREVAEYVLGGGE